MKKFNTVLGFIMLFVICLAGVTGFQKGENPDYRESMGGGEFVFENTECITEEQREEIQKQIDKNVAVLKKQGKLNDNPDAIVSFQWPLRKAGNLTDPGYYGISNYVDHDPSSGLREYNCNTRTYNGHKGTDVFSWPFGWYKMDNNQVEIIAGAAGTIVYKNDGQFDRSCTFNSNIWNAVYIRHADGSVAWYGHLKKNSLTSKNVGDNVAVGEYLGVLGSSGNSTGPHLHFEVYDVGNALRDPWQGSCNTLNNTSWWAGQKPYYEPKINALLTHKKPPVFPTCPGQELLYIQDNFNPGDSIYFISYYADQQTNSSTQFTLLRPDNSVYNTWSHSSPAYYTASYWWRRDVIPSNAMHGTWKWRAVYNSVTYEKTFEVGTTGIQTLSEEIPGSYSLLQNYPNPFNPETIINFQLPTFNKVKLSIYDMSGKEVSVLVNEELQPGTYEYSFDGDGLSSGIYFYILTAGDFNETRRMVLLK